MDNNDDNTLPFRMNDNTQGGIATGLPQVTAEEEARHREIHEKLGRFIEENFGDDTCADGSLPWILCGLACNNAVHGVGIEYARLMLQAAANSLDEILQIQLEEGPKPLWMD